MIRLLAIGRIMVAAIVLLGCVAHTPLGSRPTATHVPVLQPKPLELVTLMTLLSSDPEVREFYRVLRRSSLSNQLAQPGAYTILVPGNEAMKAMSPETRWRIEYDAAFRDRFIGLHVLDGVWDSPDLSLVETVTTVTGVMVNSDIEIIFDTEVCCGVDYGLYVGGAQVLTSAVGAENGLYLVIDRPVAGIGSDRACAEPVGG